ncbi:MAG: TetR/AcrR family transcriptional regulator [Myxococcota bacterium]
MNESVQSAILGHATRLFGQKGYGSTSVRELVEAAGVSKPTLYYHFGSKEALFLATAELHLHHLDRLIQDAIAASDTLEGQLESLFAAKLAFAGTQPDVVRFLVFFLHQVDHGQPEIDLMSVDATLVRYLGEAFYLALERKEIATDADIPVAVVSFLGIIRGWSMAAFHGAPLPPDIHRTVVRHFLNGIVPR